MLFWAILASSQGQPDLKAVYTKEELPLVAKVRVLRELPDENRGLMTKEAALEIRLLPASLNKLSLADSLAVVSSGGDLDRDTLQEVATTLADAVREQPGKLDPAYADLAQLVHYEHVKVAVNDPKLAAAISRLEAEDQRLREANFTLTDLNGKSWTLKDLRGKVVLMSFWASWNRPAREEMLDLEALYQRFKKQDLVIMAISSEKREPVANFVKLQKINFPVLLDPEQKVAQLYRITGLPRSFVYDRDGKVVAQATNVRTQKQLLSMLAPTGIR